MTEFTPRSGQDLNSFFTNPQSAMPHYAGTSAGNYVYNNGQVQYADVNTTYPTYSATYLPSHSLHAQCHYLSRAAPISAQYQPPSSKTPQPASEQHLLFQNQCVSRQHNSRSSTSLSMHFSLPQDCFQMAETEGQDSVNEDTMASESVEPPLDGYPDVKAFDMLMKK